MNNEYDSIILSGDSYKYSHHKLYPDNTQYISSYIESRYISEPFDDEPEIVHFGLQMLLSKLSKKITREQVSYADGFITKHGLPFNNDGWMHIIEHHDGYLPVKITALPEGSVINLKIPQIQIHNTDPKCFWLTSFLETSLLRSVWYPSTVATLSREIKKIIYKFLSETVAKDDSEIQEILKFKLHDFGYRGVSSQESGEIGGCAHLVNFMGSDTIGGIIAAREYYKEQMAAFSIAASEHSTITAWGQENEESAYSNMIDQFGKPGNIFACVSDSYDIYNACSHIWGENLKQKLIDSGATLVVRPDCGSPMKMTLDVVEMLGEKFGFETNSKGYKTLPPYIRIIQGDGINKKSVRNILQNYKNNGWSAENITFGMGGGLLQQVNRDSLGYAMKANAIDKGDGWEPVFKNPVNDSTKKSKAGRVAVIKENDNFSYVPEINLNGMENLLTPVFENGEIIKTWTFKEVRENAKL